jgi:hypothetical protein
MGLCSLYFTTIKMSLGHRSRDKRTRSGTLDAETKHFPYSYRWRYIQLQNEADLNDSGDVLCKYWRFCLT